MEQVVFAPILASGGGDNLLSQHIEGFLRDLYLVQVTAVNAAHSRGTFHQFIPAEREYTPLWQASPTVIGAANALQQGRDGTGWPELTNEINGTDIDP